MCLQCEHFPSGTQREKKCCSAQEHQTDPATVEKENNEEADCDPSSTHLFTFVQYSGSPTLSHDHQDTLGMSLSKLIAGWKSNLLESVHSTNEITKC